MRKHLQPMLSPI